MFEMKLIEMENVGWEMCSFASKLLYYIICFTETV
jgi:hypothetical protein